MNRVFTTYLPTPRPWSTRQTRVTSCLDTTSTLSVTVLASAKNFRLYQESSTRTSTMRMDNELAKYNDKDKSLRKVILEEYHDFLIQSGNPTVEVQG
jgi:hypothetical protein